MTRWQNFMTLLDDTIWWHNFTLDMTCGCNMKYMYWPLEHALKKCRVKNSLFEPSTWSSNSISKFPNFSKSGKKDLNWFVYKIVLYMGYSREGHGKINTVGHLNITYGAIHIHIKPFLSVSGFQISDPPLMA